MDYSRHNRLWRRTAASGWRFHRTGTITYRESEDGDCESRGLPAEYSWLRGWWTGSCGRWRGSGEGKELLFMSSRKGPQLEVVKASCQEPLQGHKRRQRLGVGEGLA